MVVVRIAFTRHGSIHPTKTWRWETISALRRSSRTLAVITKFSLGSPSMLHGIAQRHRSQASVPLAWHTACRPEALISKQHGTPTSGMGVLATANIFHKMSAGPLRLRL